mmetsp:Transcript_25460/g.55970  ORF Transcript_25460/g.55970 Transcript_25460/m.55970 type:complete len:86 (+) Transcript_25460:643-900(+)
MQKTRFNVTILSAIVCVATDIIATAVVATAAIAGVFVKRGCRARLEFGDNPGASNIHAATARVVGFAQLQRWRSFDDEKTIVTFV